MGKNLTILKRYVLVVTDIDEKWFVIFEHTIYHLSFGYVRLPQLENYFFLFCIFFLTFFLFFFCRYIYQRWSRGHKARCQGQGHKKISRPRTDPLEAKAKDQGHRRKCSQKKKERSSKFFSGDLKSLQNFFSSEKGFQKIFFRRSLLEKTKKMVFAEFPKSFWRFPRKFLRFKNSAVLEPRTGQFSRT